MVDRDIVFGISQRFGSYPDDLPFDAVSSVHTKSGSTWCRVPSGIGTDQFSIYDSDAAVTGFPIQRWQHRSDTNTMEVWPVPSQTATIRLRGQRKLRPLVDDADTCDLDSHLIVLFAAVELLGRANAADAQIKASAGRRLLTRLLAMQSQTSPFVIGSGQHDGPSLRPTLDYIP